MAAFPDKPLPYRPVVQRGETAVTGGKKYPRSRAGFVGGTVLFDADQLAAVALWHDGFLKSTPPNYFGVYLHSVGLTGTCYGTSASPCIVKLPGNVIWDRVQPPTLSDPNEGTRFDGYQIGRVAVRLHYRVFAGGERLPR